MCNVCLFIHIDWESPTCHCIASVTSPVRWLPPMLKSLPPCIPRQLLLEQALTPRLNKDLLHKPSKKKLFFGFFQSDKSQWWPPNISHFPNHWITSAQWYGATRCWQRLRAQAFQSEGPCLVPLSRQEIEFSSVYWLNIVTLCSSHGFVCSKCWPQKKSSRALSWAKTYKEQPHLHRVMQSLSLQGPKFKELLKLMRLFFLKGET